MSDRASVAAFVLSVLGASYQMVSFGLAFIVDRQFNYIYYISLYSYFNSITLLIVLWAAAHLLSTQDSHRSTWPAIILGIAAADLGNLIIAWSIQGVPNDIAFTLLPAPLLLTLGGLLGLTAARHPLVSKVA